MRNSYEEREGAPLTQAWPSREKDMEKGVYDKKKKGNSGMKD